jgi:hypothetical protein
MAQSNLRSDLQQVGLSAEKISLEGGGPYYQERLGQRVDQEILAT